MSENKIVDDVVNLTSEDLIGAARSLDAIEFLLQDLTENYFDCFDSTNKKGRFGIVVDFNRNRARANAIQELVLSIERDFKKYNIYCYN